MSLLLLSFLLVPPLSAHGQVYILRPGQEVFGAMHEHIIEDNSETLVDLAQQNDLGYNEITEANPDLDPWYPGKGKRVIIPTAWILPAIDDGHGTDQTDYYVVQTGSFSTQEHAMNHYAEVAEKIPQAVASRLRIEKVGRYFVVRLGLFRDRQASGRVLAEVRAGFPEARLLKVYYLPERIVHPEKQEEVSREQNRQRKPCILINLAEYRLYHIEQTRDGTAGLAVRTFPIGVGREGFETVLGKYRVAEKLRHPAWIIPPSAREDYPEYPRGIILPGPDDPLGDFALRLSRPDYLIHGTHKPLGVGRRVSRGCIRLYPEDIEQLFNASAIGDEVIIAYQPVKIGRSNGIAYIEAHQDYLATQGNLQQKAIALLGRTGPLADIDPAALGRLINEARGFPQALSGPATTDRDQAGVEERFRLPVPQP